MASQRTHPKHTPRKLRVAFRKVGWLAVKFTDHLTWRDASRIGTKTIGNSWTTRLAHLEWQHNTAFNFPLTWLLNLSMSQFFLQIFSHFMPLLKDKWLDKVMIPQEIRPPTHPCKNRAVQVTCIKQIWVHCLGKNGETSVEMACFKSPYLNRNRGGKIFQKSGTS